MGKLAEVTGETFASAVVNAATPVLVKFTGAG